MPTPSEAEQHLRTIRSLMERSTIYRTISAPVALVGGLVTLGMCALFTFFTLNPDTVNVLFLGCWMAVLAITAAANGFFLWNDAKRRNEPFVSPGMRMALWALCPGFLVAGVITLLLISAAYYLPVLWMVLYGVALLGTQHFAPRSIRLLGWAFLSTGIFLMFVDSSIFSHRMDFGAAWSIANVEMGVTFGLFHLVYAACTWNRGTAKDATAGAADSSNV